MKENSNKLPEIRMMVAGYIESGTYNGSLPTEIFPSVYHYSKYDCNEMEEGNNVRFKTLMEEYLATTIVNDLISLEEYLILMQEQKQDELTEIHQKYNKVMPKGNKMAQLPILLFSGEGDLPTFTLYPNLLDLKGVARAKLAEFLAEHAKHFSSEIPDPFFAAYYPS